MGGGISDLIRYTNGFKLLFYFYVILFIVFDICSTYFICNMLDVNRILKLYFILSENKKRNYYYYYYSVDFWHFRAFVSCHRAYSKTRKSRKIFIISFLEVLRLSDFEHFFKHFVRSGHNSNCCSKLSMSIYYYCLKMAFLVIKAKMVLR